MKWYGGRNYYQDVTGEYEPGGGFTYLTDLSSFPALFQKDYCVWAHAESQPVQVTARLRVAEIRDWNLRGKISRQASCELLVDGVSEWWVMPSERVDSCAQAKRRAEAHLDNEDWVERGLRIYYRNARKLTVERAGVPYATLLSERGNWMLEPGHYIQINAAGWKTSLLRGTSSVTTGSSI
jgi:hypothetical protein